MFSNAEAADVLRRGAAETEINWLRNAALMGAQALDLLGKVNAYTIYWDQTGIEVEVVRRRQRDGTSLWRVKRLSTVLMRDGEWMPEPSPSHRDPEWVVNASWHTPEEAEAGFWALRSVHKL